MTSNDYTTIGYIIATLSFASQFYQGIHNRNEKNWLKKITPIGWVVLLLGAAMLANGYFGSEVSQREKTDTARTDSVKYSELSSRFDSLKLAFDTGLTHAALRLAFGIEISTIDGKINDNKNTILLLTDALINKKDLMRSIDSLEHKLDSLQQKHLPNVTFCGDYILNCQQTNDTFYVLPRLCNSGKSTAKNVNYMVFYVHFGKNGLGYEYHRPIINITDIDIPDGNWNEVQKGKNSYMVNFRFDSSENNQFLLFTGNYENDAEKPVKKKIELTYEWNPVTKSWGILGDKTIMKQHLNNVFIPFF